MAPTTTSTSTPQDYIDPSLCNTQVYYDRDVELIRCEEEHDCPYKRYYNNMTLCDCPIDKPAGKRLHIRDFRSTLTNLKR